MGFVKIGKHALIRKQQEAQSFELRTFHGILFLL